ncbi:MAG: fluoride efflux transporter CrcB [Rhizobiales bacterium]|nr:fluoride efflux transporter CrcB [Hyphomicrobiales bacterium]
MFHLMLVALGGAVGAASRHLVGLVALRALGPGFPVGTLVVNILGSFLMGLLIAILARKGAAITSATEWRLFLATGVLGGFTTFSAFSLDAVLLWQRGESVSAIFYVLGSVALSILALMAGLMLVRATA